METIRLIGVGACTLLAGVLASGITAYITAWISRKQREEDRFIWKREKLIDVITDLLDLSRENQEMLNKPLDRGKLTSQSLRLRRIQEMLLLLDSGMVAMTGTELITAEGARLLAVANPPGGALPNEIRRELDEKCVEGGAALVAAMRITLGDPTQSPDMKRRAEEITKKWKKSGRRGKTVKGSSATG